MLSHLAAVNQAIHWVTADVSSQINNDVKYTKLSCPEKIVKKLSARRKISAFAAFVSSFNLLGVIAAFQSLGDV